MDVMLKIQLRLTSSVFFAGESVIVRESLLEIGSSLAIATLGLKTIYCCKNPPSKNI